MITVIYSPVTKGKVELESVCSAFNPVIVAKSKNAFSLSTGVVIYIGEDPIADDGVRYNVVVQYDADTVFVYGKLTSIDVKLTDIVTPGQLIGTSKSVISFGVGLRIKLTEFQPAITNSVRIGGQSFGYVDALRWFDGSVDLNDVIFEGFTFSKDVEVDVTSADMEDEFSDGRG